jgi:hypothetical protein
VEDSSFEVAICDLKIFPAQSASTYELERGGVLRLAMQRGIARLYSPSPASSLLSVGLCFSAFVFRFLPAGSARVGGGLPIAARAAAFTADAARNDFVLRFFDGIDRAFQKD